VVDPNFWLFQVGFDWRQFGIRVLNGLLHGFGEVLDVCVQLKI
jgi:hypothetical protein